MSDDRVTARAAELAERILDEVSSSDQDWGNISVHGGTARGPRAGRSVRRRAEPGAAAGRSADVPLPSDTPPGRAEFASAFGALAHPTRLRILEALAEPRARSARSSSSAVSSPGRPRERRPPRAPALRPRPDRAGGNTTGTRGARALLRAVPARSRAARPLGSRGRVRTGARPRPAVPAPGAPVASVRRLALQYLSTVAVLPQGHRARSKQASFRIALRRRGATRRRYFDSCTRPVTC